MFLSFLQDSKIGVEEVTAVSRTVKKDRNPDPNFVGIRVWKDGSVFPSEALVEALNLEYVSVKLSMVPVEKDGVAVMEEKDGKQIQKLKRVYEYPAEVGNGLDVIYSQDWAQWMVPENPHRDKKVLFISVVQKSEPKVDLFSTTRYNDDGTPISSVLTQGANTFGKDALLPVLKTAYNVEPSEEEGYIDLFIDLSQDVSALGKKGIFLIPKTISRGDKAGQLEYQRRENIKMFAIIPASFVESGESQSEEKEEAVLLSE